MLTSDDRWTCPVCDRTFVLGDGQPDDALGLGALQSRHAQDHAGERGRQPSSRSRSGDMERAPRRP